MYKAVPFTVPPKIILFNTEQSNPQKHRSIRKYQALIVTYITLEEMWDLRRQLSTLSLMYAYILGRPFSEILHITLLIHIPWPTFYLTRVKLLQLHSHQLHSPLADSSHFLILLCFFSILFVNIPIIKSFIHRCCYKNLGVTSTVTPAIPFYLW